MITDTNVNLSRWPFRRLAGDEPSLLMAKLRQGGVTEAWAGSFDGLLHRDIAAVNARLAADCKTYGKGSLVPFGSVNPKLPDWREDLRRCAQDHAMPGIRLHPNYHGYELKDPVFPELLQLAADNRLVVQLVVSMEDIRTQHPLLRTPPVNLTLLPELVRSQPSVQLVLLNWSPFLRGQRLGPYADSGAIYFEISTVEGIQGIARLVEALPTERVLFGSNFPLFYLEAALLKLKESGLPESKVTMLCEDNARRILSRSAPQRSAGPR